MIELLQYEFMRNALIAGVLASIATGIIGTYVIVKRIVFISGGISHASFGGIGLGYFAGINPILGALVFTIASALGIGLVSRRTRQREDTSIGMFWVVGMAIGIIFIGLTPGYAPDLFSYLFGNILAIPRSDIFLMVALDGIILTTVFLLYKEFLALSFDEEFTNLRGVDVEKLYLVLLTMVALTVVVLIRIVGVILVIALLTVPAAIAVQHLKNIGKIMVLSAILGAVFTTSGLWISYLLDLASGATIILVSVVGFLVSSLYRGLRHRVKYDIKQEKMIN